MESQLRIFLPLYCFLYAIVCFVWRWVIFKRRTGKNPVILGDTETPHGYVGLCSKALMLLAAFEILSFAIRPEIYRTGPFQIWILPEFLIYVGGALLAISMVLTAVAQKQMGNSWRVGIETPEKTELVRQGFYKYSRNPIYLGIMLTLIGLFLVFPNPLSFLVLVLGHVLLQMIVRLEEAHLRGMQGESYREYCRNVRRWI